MQHSLTPRTITLFDYSAGWLMFGTPMWTLCTLKQALLLIYWYIAMCNEYPKLQWFAADDIIADSQVFDSQYLDRTQEACKCNVSATLQHFCVHASWKTPNHATPNSSPPFPARVPSFLFPSLFQLISGWFSTKSHLGKTSCQLRWAFTQKTTASPQHLSPWIKDIFV